MAILLIAATNLELGSIPPMPGVDVLITGVGPTATCYNLVNKLFENRYELLLQVGIGGSFQEDIKPGDIVAVKQDCFGDLGLEEKGVFVPVFQTPLADANAFPFENGWLVNNYRIEGTENLRHVKAVTINRVTDNINQRDQLVNHFEPAVESMEGAAFHYVAIQQQIPFMQLRAISNYVGDRNKENWQIEQALANLTAEVTLIVAKTLMSEIKVEL